MDFLKSSDANHKPIKFLKQSEGPKELLQEGNSPYDFEIKFETHLLKYSIIEVIENVMKDTIEYRLTVKIDGEIKTSVQSLTNEFLYDVYNNGEEEIILTIISQNLCNKIGFPQLNNVVFDRHFAKALNKSVSSVGELVKSPNMPKYKGPSISQAAATLPGYNVLVEYPCDCLGPMVRATIGKIVIHLNDRDKWSREKIADWLDLIADRDGIDITFKVDIDD